MNIQALANAVRWFTAAMADVRAAQTLSAVPQPHASLVCFHCQQAAELMLKGVLAFHEQPVPSTHHIALLLRQVKAHSALLQGLPSERGLLTVYAADTLDPDGEEPSEEEMRRALDLMLSLRHALSEAKYPLHD